MRALVLLLVFGGTATGVPDAQSQVDEARRRYTAGRAALENNQVDVAVRELQEAQKLAPTNAVILYALAMAQDRQGAYRPALGNVQKALALGLDASLQPSAEQLVAKLRPLVVVPQGPANSALTMFRGSWSGTYERRSNPGEKYYERDTYSWRLLFDDPPAGPQIVGRLEWSNRYTVIGVSQSTDRTVAHTSAADVIIRAVGNDYEFDMRSPRCTGGDCAEFKGWTGRTHKISLLSPVEFTLDGLSTGTALSSYRKDGVGGYDDQRKQTEIAGQQASRDRDQAARVARIAEVPRLCDELKARLSDVAGKWLVGSRAEQYTKYNRYLELQGAGAELRGVERSEYVWLDSDRRSRTERWATQVRLTVDCTAEYAVYRLDALGETECPGCSDVGMLHMDRERGGRYLSWSDGQLRRADQPGTSSSGDLLRRVQ